MNLSKLFAVGALAFAASAASASVPVLFEDGDNFGTNPVNAQFLANGQGESDFFFTLADTQVGFFSTFDLRIEDMGSLFKNPVTIKSVSVVGGTYSQSLFPATGVKSVTFSGLTAGNYTLTFDNTVRGFGGLVGKASTVVTAVTPVPEAETYALALAGLGVVGLVAARRRKAQ